MSELKDIWYGLIKLMEQALIFLSFGGKIDYGIAIVLLTVAIRALLLPLTIKQTKSMVEMQRVQPKLKALQAKYKNDKQKLQQEMMKFYTEHKVNPFGGCLPLILQLPIMFALFIMLKDSEVLKKATTILLGNKELSKALGDFFIGFTKLKESSTFFDIYPYIILLLLLVGTNYLMTHMLSNDPQQKKMNIFMTLFMLWIGWQFPAGVLIYWVTFNVLTVMQQYFTMRSMGVTEEQGSG